MQSNQRFNAKDLETDYEKLNYITDPIVDKLKVDGTDQINCGAIRSGDFAKWASRELAERLNLEPPDGLYDLPERDRRAIYYFVMGRIHQIQLDMA